MQNVKYVNCYINVLQVTIDEATIPANRNYCFLHLLRWHSLFEYITWNINEYLISSLIEDRFSLSSKQD